MSREQSTIKTTSKATFSSKILFTFAVTEETIEQIVIAATLNCKASHRGIISFLKTIFDYDISIGTVNNILREASITARKVNESEDLSRVEIGAHDEIFQGQDPVLVGNCTRTTYCYLLEKVNARDSTTWGVHCLDLKEKGLNPRAIIGDYGQGLRAGQAAAFPDAEFRADVFHVVYDFGKVLFYCTNRAYGAMSKRFVAENKMIKAKKKKQGNQHSKNLIRVREKEAKAIKAAETLEILFGWLQHDVFAIVGPDHAMRSNLFDFIIQELRNIQELSPYHIGKLITKLINQKDDLLKFVVEIQQRLTAVAKKYNVERELVMTTYCLQAISPSNNSLWRQLDQLKTKLGTLYYQIEAAVQEIIETTIRASSVVENINSRLRSYFFLRKQFGQKALDLLRAFLNHNPLERSGREERVGKSPAELLSGKPHPHFLEMLGYTLFKRAA